VILNGNIMESDQQGFNYYTAEGFTAQLAQNGIK
jgi:hypothetical protein